MLPVAASGNTGTAGNRSQFPAAVLGGRRGRPGIGLSVAATSPDGKHADFSTHNDFVSIAAPGASDGCDARRAVDAARVHRHRWDVPAGHMPVA